MRKLLLSIFMLLTLIPAVSAEGDTEDPGVTPDSIFYFFDKALESLDLALTFDDEAKVEKFIKYAEERLAEAEVMNEEEKQEYIEELILDYLENIETASDEMVDLEEDEADNQEANLDDAIVMSNDISGELPNDLYEKLEQKKGEAYIKFSVLRESLGDDAEAVIDLANANEIGLGELAKIASGALLIEADLMTTLEGVIEAGGIEEYFAEYGYKVSDLVDKGVEVKQERILRKLEEAIENGNEKRVRQIENQLARSVAISDYRIAKDEINAKRDEYLLEYGVTEVDELPEEIIAELKAAQKEAVQSKKNSMKQKETEIRESVDELVKEHKNGKSSSFDLGGLRDKVRGSKEDSSESDEE